VQQIQQTADLSLQTNYSKLQLSVNIGSRSAG